MLFSPQVVPGLAFNFCFYDTFRNIALAYQWRQLIAQQPHQQQTGEGGGTQQPGPGGSGADQAGAAASPSPLASALCACAAGWCTSSLTFPLDVVRRRLQVGWVEAGASGARCRRGPCGGNEGWGLQRERAHGRTRGAGRQALGRGVGMARAPSQAVGQGCACWGSGGEQAAHGSLRSLFPVQVYENGAQGRMRYGDVVRDMYRRGGLRSFYRGIALEYSKVLPGMAIAFTTYEALKRLTGSTATAQ